MRIFHTVYLVEGVQGGRGALGVQGVLVVEGGQEASPSRDLGERGPGEEEREVGELLDHS